MGRPANFVIVSSIAWKTDAVILRDVGRPWDRFLTITNDAENVVDKLFKERELKPGQRLLYFDSDNELTELLIKDGKFAGVCSRKTIKG